MGRSSIRGSPVNSTVTFEAASAAHKGRMAVPALPKNKLSGLSTENAPPKPVTLHSVLSSLKLYSTPSNLRASSIWRISSLSSRLVRRVSPFASAASSKARLDRLFEPGTLTVPSILLTGCNVNCSTLMRDAPRSPA